MIGTFRMKVTDKTLKHMATYTRYAAGEHVSRYAYFCVKPALVTSVINQDGRVRLLKTREGSPSTKTNLSKSLDEISDIYDRYVCKALER